MKYLLFVFLLVVTVDLLAQDIPASYTPNLGLRKYDLDDYPGSDSLNANSDAIDAGYKRNKDSLAIHAADIYSAIKYTGGLKNAVVAASNLATSLDTNLVKTTGTDNIYDNKTFLGGISTFKNILPAVTDDHVLGSYFSFSQYRWEWSAIKYLLVEEIMLTAPNYISDTTAAAIWTYDGASVSLNKPIEIDSFTVRKHFAMDSAASFQSFKLEPNTYSIVDVGDTVITTANLMSNMQLTLPGDVSSGIETINMTGAASGHILIIYTTDIDDSVLFVDRDIEADGNLEMGGNLWLRGGDNIAFQFIYDQPALSWIWMELWRKNN